jgi:aldehyde:ferredoxin oxidoreductase
MGTAKNSYRGGYMGRILHVDLSTRKVGHEELPGNDILRKYIGCWGLGLKYLYDLLPAGYSASDPENPLIFMTAPLTGVPLPSANNVTLATKNFDTGFTVGRSHTHHNFGRYIKGNGYDGMIITGKADEPVYLWIHDEKAELLDASHLWGRADTHETDDVIKKELGNPEISVAAIGPCGENLVAGGMIMNDKNHGFSHSGVGTVMGSKKLKAIAVFGNKPIFAVDPDRLADLRKEMTKTAMGDPGHVSSVVHKQKSKRGDYRKQLEAIGFCGKNFQTNYYEEFGIGMHKHRFTPRPCPGCPIACSYDLEITSGPHKGYVSTLCGGGEALEGSGSILGIPNPEHFFYLTDQYDRLGIEGSMAGCTLAMAIEAFEKGLITTEDTDGLELRWGDPEVAEALLRKMVYKEGFGEILARGMKEAAEWIGGEAPSFAVNVKGTGMSLHDWRPAWGYLLGQIVGSGAGWPAPGADAFATEPNAGYDVQTDPFDYRNKPMEVKKMGIVKMANDCTGLCMFITWGLKGGNAFVVEALNAATGWDISVEEYLDVGERVMHLERAFNVRHGLRPEDDWIVPERLLEAPPDGRAKGRSIGPYLEWMVKEYHRLMDWDPITGKPFRRALSRLGLDEVIKDLWEQ